MPQVSWHAGADGRYWIDAALGRHAFRFMLDLGLVDPGKRVGFAVEPAVYDQLKRAGELAHFVTRFHRDASGHGSASESGSITASLIDPASGRSVGPTVDLWVLRGAANVPSRVGVVFFHLLRNCRVVWELVQRVWCIEYP